MPTEITAKLIEIHKWKYAFKRGKNLVRYWVNKTNDMLTGHHDDETEKNSGQ